MGTISDKLTYIEGTKDAIKQAIIAKGVSVSDSDTFRSYADKINSIQGGGGGDKMDGYGMCFSDSTFTEFNPTVIDFTRLTSANSMFKNCFNMVSVGYMNTKNVTDMNSMFFQCSKLQTIPQFNTSNVVRMESLFSNCTSLQSIPLLDTSKVTIMNNMFYGCSKLAEVPELNTANVKEMTNIFNKCTSLQTIPSINTSNAKYLNNLIYNCTNLQSLPLLDATNATSVTNLAYGCTSLTTVGGLTGLKLSISFSESSLLTVDSVMNIINEAADMSASPQTLTLHANVYAKLNEEQIATATAKGWNIAEK